MRTWTKWWIIIAWIISWIMWQSYNEEMMDHHEIERTMNHECGSNNEKETTHDWECWTYRLDYLWWWLGSGLWLLPTFFVNIICEWNDHSLLQLKFWQIILLGLQTCCKPVLLFKAYNCKIHRASFFTHKKQRWSASVPLFSLLKTEIISASLMLIGFNHFNPNLGCKNQPISPWMAGFVMSPSQKTYSYDPKYEL